MAEFVYTAKDKTGKLIKDTVAADTDVAAARTVSARGLFPISVIMAGREGAFQKFNIFRRVPTKQKVLFARQLSTMVNAGLPIDQSLSTLAEQATNKTLREILLKVTASVQSGSPLSRALAAYPDVFSQTFVTLVASGESSGTLDKVLLRLALQMEKDFSLISKLRSAAVYPVFVILFVLVTMIVMTVFVVPKFAEFYASFGRELPLATRVMLAISGFVIKFWYLALAFIFFAVITLRRFLITPAGKRFIDPVKLRLPGISVIFKDVYMARFTRTLGTLVGSGVPLLDALAIVSDTVNNVVIKNDILGIASQVKRGVALSVPISENKEHFPVIVAQMVKVGEKTGELDSVLAKLADYYDEELDYISKNLSSLVEPVLIIIVGFLVFIFIVVLLLPIYNIVFTLSGPDIGTFTRGTGI